MLQGYVPATKFKFQTRLKIVRKIFVTRYFKRNIVEQKIKGVRKSLYMKILIYYLREIIFIFIFHKGKIKTNKYLIHPYHCNTRKKLARKTDTYANYPFFPKSAHLLQTKVLPVKVSNFKTDINLYNSLRTKHITVSLLSRSSCSTIFYH